jgi:hypothetical protein
MPFGHRSQDGSDIFYYTKEHGTKLVELVDYLVTAGIKINFDCVLPPCIFSKEQYNYLLLIADNVRSRCIEEDVSDASSNAPMDIFEDATVRYCYPTSDISIQLDDYASYEELQEALRLEYRRKQLRTRMPLKCLTCSDFKIRCSGPCMGFFNERN